MTTTTEDLRLVGPREAADVLALSLRQLDRLVDAGVVRPSRLTERGHRRFRIIDLAALVAAEKED